MTLKEYILRADKVVTVSKKYGTLQDGAMVISGGKIIEVGSYTLIKSKYNLDVLDFHDYVITPSLVDCHTHVLEYAPTSLFPVTGATHLMGSISLILKVLSSGITSLGEQVCGHPESDLGKIDYLAAVKDLPIDITFSLSSISIGLKEISHFSGVTGSKSLSKEMLISEDILNQLITQSDYPGENVFINATPANLEDILVPRAGEIIYTQEELDNIVALYHANGKRIGCHVGGQEAIEMAINSGFDIIHHGHEMTKVQIQKVIDNDISIVATPLGGTHLAPNKPDEIVEMVVRGVDLSISSDGYLPPSKKAPWLQFKDNNLKGPEDLMLLSHPSMLMLKELDYDESEILQLITLNPAKVLGKDKLYGSLEEGKDANFIVSKGIPGLEITNPEDVLQVYFKGEMIIDKLK